MVLSRLPLIALLTLGVSACTVRLDANSVMGGDPMTAEQLGNSRRLQDYRLTTGDHVIGFRTNLDPTMPLTGPAQSTFLIFRGGSGNIALEWVTLLSELLMDQGHNVVLMEYPDAGLSGGTLTFAAVRDSTDAFVEHLFDAGTLRPKDTVVIYGLSFGSLPSLHLAAQGPRMQRLDIDGVMVEGGLSSTAAMRDHYSTSRPLYAALDALATVELDPDLAFDNVAAIAATRVPTYLIHSQDDATIPVSMTREMAAAARYLYDAWYPTTGGHVASAFQHREEFLTRLERFVAHID